MAESSDVLDTIDLLYRAALEPALWPQALHRFALAVGGMGTALIPITPGSAVGLILSPDLLEARAEYDREWYRYDSRVLRIHQRKLTDGVWSESELFGEDEIASDPLRQDFCRSYGMGAFAVQLVTPMPNFVVAFSVMRALDRGAFERGELDTLNLLGKHAARALLVSTSVQKVQSLERMLTDALTRTACAVFALDRNLQVVFANPAAECLLGDGLCIRDGQLRAQSPAHASSLPRLLRSALQPNRRVADLETVALPRPSSQRPLLAQAIPVFVDSTVGLPATTAALLIVVDPEKQESQSPVRELRLLGLTPSETRLACLIGAGHSRAEAAQLLGLADSTVASTIKVVYAKLGISRQSELVRLVDRLAVLGPDRHRG